MPNNLHISDEMRAQRHVLSQQLYRHRKRYKMLKAMGSHLQAGFVLDEIEEMKQAYNSMGGYPMHQGNVL